MKRPALILAAILVVSAAALVALSQTEAGQLLLGRWTFTRSVEVDRGTYFRLKVKVAYKGEPQDFDIVVGCNVRWTSYKDNSRTYEAGLVPTLFGRRMSDGAGLVVRPPDACGGETTANSGVPAEFIPIIIVYDDADTMGFGTGYMTEDAYASPLSVLDFGGATIESATNEDFDEFRAEQTNIVTPAMYFSDSQADLERHNLKAPPVRFGQRCFGYSRFRLIGERRTAAQGLWPEDRPQYWRLSSKDKSALIASRAELVQTDDPDAVSHTRYQFMRGVEPDAPDFGAPTHTGNGLIGPKGIYPPSVYPDLGAWVSRPPAERMNEGALEILRNGPRVLASIDFRGGQTKGFAYCWSPPSSLLSSGGYTGTEREAILGSYNDMSPVSLVDGTRIASSEPGATPAYIVERDEYLFRTFQISLDSTRGGV